MTEYDSHGVYRRKVAMVVIDRHRVAKTATSAKLSTTLTQKNQRVVWRCCSWLSPQRQRTRREEADHFHQPPTSRSSHQRGSAAKPMGLQRRCVQERSRPRHTTTWNPPNQWNLSGPNLLEKEVIDDGSEEEGRQEAGQEGREEEEVRNLSSIVSVSSRYAPGLCGAPAAFPPHSWGGGARRRWGSTYKEGPHDFLLKLLPPEHPFGIVETASSSTPASLSRGPTTRCRKSLSNPRSAQFASASAARR